jgi:hypothetical protein
MFKIKNRKEKRNSVIITSTLDESVNCGGGGTMHILKHWQLKICSLSGVSASFKQNE